MGELFVAVLADILAAHDARELVAAEAWRDTPDGPEKELALERVAELRRHRQGLALELRRYWVGSDFDPGVRS